MRNSYTIYRVKSRIRLILMLVGVTALITLVTFLFVYIIQRNQPQKTAFLSSSNSGSMASKVSSLSSSSGGTSSLSSDFTQMKDWRLVLVNSTHKIPSDFHLQLVAIDKKVSMDKRIMQDFNNMRFAAHIENLSIWISVAYRSQELQQSLYSDEISNNIKAGMSSSAATAAAKKAVALPGYSEHHTGLAMDLNGVLPSFDTTKEFAWLQQHAADYGFILRYPKDKENITKIIYEPWHYRYVGVKNAKKMKELNMCLEEYIDYLKKNHLDPIE
ncbi:MAG TPA: M15 family metallopeptidase [Oscillospiraceae bacterium]|nr:M15 family metallopeptidase [Oscillospiraceae bacterium]